MLRNMLSTKEVAERLGVSVRTVHRRVESGLLVPTQTIPGNTRIAAYLFDEADVARLQKERAA